MREVVVFDFDGTLIKEDSLTKTFLKSCRGLYLYKAIIYMSLKVMSKLGLISIRKEKEMAIRLVFGNEYIPFAQACASAAESLTPLTAMDALEASLAKGDHVIILTATAVELVEAYLNLKGIKNIEIVATTLIVANDNKIQGILNHPYGKEKVRALKELGYKTVDRCFFDSDSDRCLEDICPNCIMVKD